MPMMITPQPDDYKPEPPTPKDSWIVWYLVIAIVLIAFFAFAYIKSYVL